MRAITAILFRNLTAFSRDKMRFFFTLFMSGFFLFIFSFVMKAAATGIAAPMNYLISGIIIMTVFQSALNNSMNIIEDVASGFMKEIMVAPIARWQISLGQIASATAISVLQGMLIVIIGLFIGAPLLAREIESGTYRFTWTQEVSRTRFVLTTFVMLAAVVTAVACLLGLLLGWYGHPFEVVGVESQWQSGLFDTTVFMLGAWTLVALALGTFLGALIGRTVAAMAATTAVVGGLLIVSFLNLVHDLLGVGAIATSKITPNGFGIGALNDRNYVSGPPPGSWLVHGWITGPNGHVLITTAANNVLGRAYDATAKNFANNAVPRWLSIHHFTYWVSYQPASRFWVFQCVAGVILIGLAALLVSATIRALARRAAH